MSYEHRLNLYRKIEEARGRPLIVYVTSNRPNASGQMSPDVIPELALQLSKIPKAKKSIDILVVSNGGDPTVAWRVISMLRERFDAVSVLLPFVAYSAATLLALGADEIVMHPFSNLGPVDPQLTHVRPAQGPGARGPPEIIQYGAEDLRHFLDFVKTDVGISDQEQLERAFEFICKDVGAISIGVAKRSTQLSLTMGEKLLSLHMGGDQNKARGIAQALNRSYFHHGYPVGRKEAKTIGLPVSEPDSKLEGLIWEAWVDIEEEMECARPFDPLAVVLSNPTTADTLLTMPQVQLPPNLPPAILQQFIGAVLPQIGIVNVPPTDCELLAATLESTNCRSAFKTRLKIGAVRNADLTIGISVVKSETGWIRNTPQDPPLEASQP